MEICDRCSSSSVKMSSRSATLLLDNRWIIVQDQPCLEWPAEAISPE